MTGIEQAPGGEWYFNLVGWPIWVVLPLAVLAFWGIRRLGRKELAPLKDSTRKRLLALRGVTAALVVVFLIEPTCTHRRADVELPTVAVLLDTSGSMAVEDRTMSATSRLNEAVALGLAPRELRDTSMMDAASALRKTLDDAPAIANALRRKRSPVSPTPGQALVGPAGRPGGPRRTRTAAADEARRKVEGHLKRLRRLAPGLAGRPELRDSATDVVLLLEFARRRLEEADERASGRDGSRGKDKARDDIPRAEEVASRLRKLQEDGRDLVRKCRRAQQAADAALVAGAEKESPLAKGLAELDEMSRYERVRRLVAEKLAPVLRGARLEHSALAPGLAPIEVGRRNGVSLVGPTDFGGPLSDLAKTTADEHLGGVLLLTDGRQTAGGDPVPPVRALRARGTGLAAVMVGDPEPPRDAVVGDMLGATDVFRGETVRLDVRFRITGFGERPWDLILGREGKEIERREVRGTGLWQQERFEFPADETGIMHVQARLELKPDQGPAQPSASAGQAPQAGAGGLQDLRHGLLREYWSGIDGYEVADLTGSPRFRGKADGTEIVESFETDEDWGERYGSRLRGYLVPPVTGSYKFWIAADDKAELWLSHDHSVAAKALIASVTDWVPFREWTKYKSQTSARVTLRAGRPYYVEVLHKESIGGDHVSVGWQMPDSAIERPIPGDRLFAYRRGLEKEFAEGLDPVLAQGPLVEASRDNNSMQVVVSVSEDPMKALLVDHHPRWESRYLMTLLERDRRVELVRRFMAVRLPRGERELLPADQEELDSYDLLVLGDIKPDELAPEDQERISAFVGGRGGFLIVLAGSRGMPADYSLGGLADVLPVKNAPRPSAEGRGGGAGEAGGGAAGSGGGRYGEEGRGGSQRATLALTEDGGDSPVTSVLDDAALNRKLWPALPPLVWIARGVAPKTGGSVLLEADDEPRTPVVAVARYGAGRVLYIGTDESWRWRDRLGDRVHQTFWLQALRWGLGARLRGKDPRLQVSIDRTLVSPEEAVEVRARAHLADGSAFTGPVRLRIERLADSGEPVPGTAKELEMSRVSDSAEIRRQSLENLSEGDWRLTVTADGPELDGLAEVRELTVRKSQGREGVDLGADPAALERLAEAGGGRAGGFAEAESIAAELARGLEARRRYSVRRYDLWSSYWALLAVVALLFGEWMWRKRYGLP